MAESRKATQFFRDNALTPREHQHGPDAPLPVRKGGAVLAVYEHSVNALDPPPARHARRRSQS